MHFRTLALAALVFAGCTRTFTSPQAAQQNNVTPQINGTRCDVDAGTVCASGVCTDGYCCEHSCNADQRCDELGHEGICTIRQLGEGCRADADCSTGFCRDSVCCESDCSDACVVCNGKLHPGVCEVVDDNTDPRGQCGGQCLTCFGGFCGPAELGSNPSQVNPCAMGQGCGADLNCHVTDGGPCQNDDTCAAGSCVLGSCLNSQIELLPFTTVPSANSFAVGVEAAAATPEGDEATILSDGEAYDDGSGDLQQLRVGLHLYHHQKGADWTAQPLSSLLDTDLEDHFGHYGEVLYLGRRLYAITLGPAGTGLVGRQVFDNNQLEETETIDAAAAESSNTNDSFWMVTLVPSSSRAEVAYDDPRGFHVRARDLASGSWSTVTDVPRPTDYSLDSFAAAKVNGHWVFFYAVVGQDTSYSSSGIAAIDDQGHELARATGASNPCGDEQGNGIFLDSARGEPPGYAHFTISCGDTRKAGLGTLDSHGNLSFEMLLGTELQPPYVQAIDYTEDEVYPRIIYAQVNDFSNSSLNVALPDVSQSSVVFSSGNGFPGTIATSANHTGAVSAAFVFYDYDVATNAYDNPQLRWMRLTR